MSDRSYHSDVPLPDESSFFVTETPAARAKNSSRTSQRNRHSVVSEGLQRNSLTLRLCNGVVVSTIPSDIDILAAIIGWHMRGIYIDCAYLSSVIVGQEYGPDVH